MSSSRRARCARLAFVLLAGGALVAPSAIAHSDPGRAAASERAAAGPPGGEFRRVEGLGPARRTGDGLLEVRLGDGTTTTTHGTDFARNAESNVNTQYPNGNLSPRCVDVNGSTDPYPNPGRVELVYVVPAGRADNYATHAGQMRWTLGRMTWWLDERARATSGNTVGMRVNTFCLNGQIHVSRVISSLATTASFSDVVTYLRNRGYTHPNVKYLVLFDAPTAGRTGTADFRSDCSGGNTNANMQSGPVATSMFGVVWSAHWFYENGTTALHEMLHTMGAVQACAPNRSSYAHCRDDIDVMCYDDDGNPATYPMYTRCTLGTIDCGDDDYLDGLPEGLEFFGNWNVAQLYNRFVTING